MQSVVGELSFLKCYPSGWAIGKIKLANGEKLSANGNALNGLKEKSTYEFYGTSTVDPQWGKQLKVSKVSVFVPAQKSGIVKYLTKNYSGVGQKTAEKFIDSHINNGGTIESLRELILDNPFAIDFSSVSNRKTESNDKGGMKGAIYRVFATKLGGLDTQDSTFRSLASYYEKVFEGQENAVSLAWNLFQSNPYLPIRDLDGYGFLRADILGGKLGIFGSAKCRVAALATYAIDEGCKTNGHTYLTLDDFRERIAKIDPSVSVLDAIDFAVQMGEPICEEGGRYYIKRYLQAEKFLANDFAVRQNNLRYPLLSKVVDVNAEIDKASAAVNLNLDDSQRKAVFGLLKSPKTIHTITAGPGCGKTAIMEVVVSILIKHRNVGFCAPTGKAAKVLNARVKKIGATATTIHSMLGVGDGGGFLHGYHNKLPYDLLIVDEASMVELTLLNSLMSAVKESSHVVFLGDVKQLPSVGPGNCLADILSLNFDHHRLTKTHRNDGGILDVVNQAGEGFIDFRQRDDVQFIPRLEEADADGIDSVVEIYDRELKSVDYDFSQVGLLIARRKGDINNPGWNTTYLNNLIRNKYNANGERIPGTFFRVSDRVIIRKNINIKYDSVLEIEDQSVVNGDTGAIRNFILSQDNVEWIIIELDDGRELRFPCAEAGHLDLAYAMTVHSAQGSEFASLISICINGSPNFIHRGILFTAFSRAQKKLTIIGEQGVISQILNRPFPTRNTFLVDRVNASARLPREETINY